MAMDSILLLTAALWLITANAAMISEKCNRELEVDQSSSYSVPSELEGYDCRYTIKGHRRNQIMCPSSPATHNRNGCVNGKRVTITDGSWTRDYIYCENKGMEYISMSRQITVTFSGAGESKKFQCKMMPYQCEDQCACEEKNDVYPMIAKLTDVVQSGYTCAATIINDLQVLTAAHCVVNKEIEDLRVHVGWFENGNALDSKVDPTQSFSLESVRVHENYNVSSYDYDIAIVTLKLPFGISYSDTIYPVYLPAIPRKIPIAAEIEVLGWGFDDAGSPSLFLERARMIVANNKNCNTSYSGLIDGYTCAIPASTPTGPYSGGGPVLWKVPQTKKMILIGIAKPRTSDWAEREVAYLKIDQFIEWFTKDNDILGIENKKRCQF